MTCSPLQKQLKNLIKSAIIKTNFLGIEVRPSEKKNECANRFVCLFFSVAVAVLCVLFAGMEAKSIMHVYDLKPASASLISPELSRSTQTSAEELTGLRQVSVRLEADQRLRHRSGVETQVLIMLAVLLANTVFYKAKKHLLTRNDADGRRFIICYIHHRDGQKH